MYDITFLTFNLNVPFL